MEAQNKTENLREENKLCGKQKTPRIHKMKSQTTMQHSFNPHTADDEHNSHTAVKIYLKSPSFCVITEAHCVECIIFTDHERTQQSSKPGIEL